TQTILSLRDNTVCSRHTLQTVQHTKCAGCYALLGSFSFFYRYPGHRPERNNYIYICCAFFPQNFVYHFPIFFTMDGFLLLAIFWFSETIFSASSRLMHFLFAIL